MKYLTECSSFPQLESRQMSDKITNTPHSSPPQNPLPALAGFLPVLNPVFQGLNWTKQANNLLHIDFQIKSLLITSIFPAGSTALEPSFVAQTSSSAWMPGSHVLPRFAINFCWKHSGLILSPLQFYMWLWISNLPVKGRGSCLVLK